MKVAIFSSAKPRARVDDMASLLLGSIALPPGRELLPQHGFGPSAVELADIPRKAGDRCGPPGCKLVPTEGPKVRDDPLFTYNGKSTMFYMKEGVQTTLLEWTSQEDGDAAMALTGSTFGRPGSASQWFDRLVISQNGQTVLAVKAANSSMLLARDETVVSHAQFSGAKGKNIPASRLPDRFEMWRKLNVEAGGIKMRIFAAKAAKLATNEEQAKYTHLNVDFEGALPNHAHGIFAELGGVKPMSPATKELLKQPNKQRTASSAARALHLQSKEQVACTYIGNHGVTAGDNSHKDQPLWDAWCARVCAKLLSRRLINLRRPQGGPL